MKMKNYITNEASYIGNIGFEELVKFYKIANKSDIKKMEEIIKNNEWIAFKRLIRKVTRVNLK